MCKSKNIAFGFIVILFLSCTRQAGDLRRGEREWIAQENAVRITISARMRGGSYSATEFDSACDFFRNLVGISISRDINSWGSKANGRTPLGLVRAQLWFKRNHDRLVWSEEKGKVEVLAPQGEAAALWWRNEKILIDLNRDRHIDAASVESTRKFFLSLTGFEIPAPESHPALGIVPAEGSQEALQFLRDWYEIHAEELCVDRLNSLEICRNGS